MKIGKLHSSDFTKDYRVSHLLVNLGWVFFDLSVPASCPHRIGQTMNTQNSIQSNQVHQQMEHPVITCAMLLDMRYAVPER